MKLPTILEQISKTLEQNNARAIVVGGLVRDYFLNFPSKDYDVEVYGLESLEHLEEILQRFAKVNLVGKSFGVLKFNHEGIAYDFSFPRSEIKVGKGHQGFEVAVDGNMSFKQGAKRRDFKINAMGYDIQNKTFLDPFDAKSDMEKKVLRHIDDKTFIEDPLRVYRAIQFCARFGYTLAKETKELCKQMVSSGMLDELAKERVYVEFKKLLLKSPKPSVGFELMRELGIVSYFPELKALIDVPQSVKWHPEGDVWIHTMMSVDEMAKLLGDNEKQNLKYMFAILCHDLGKASTTTVDEMGTIRAIGHEYEGVACTKKLMYRLTDEHDFIESILPLVEHHLKPSQFYADKSKERAIRKLATKVNIEELVAVARADFLGRTTKEALSGIYAAGDWLLEKATNLKVQNKPLKNILQGRDLIALGFTPSVKFKEILDAVYALQLEGSISTQEEALLFVQKEFT